MLPVRATPSVLTGVLWYSTGQKYSLCYQKVHANWVCVICRHLCIKPRTSDRAKKFVRVIRGSVLCESMLTKFYCIQSTVTLAWSSVSEDKLCAVVHDSILGLKWLMMAWTLTIAFVRRIADSFHCTSVVVYRSARSPGHNAVTSCQQRCIVINYNNNLLQSLITL